MILGEPIPFRCWDGEYVVYNPLSGDTHLLDIVTGKVLKSIMSASSHTVDLRRSVAAFLEVPDDNDLARQVDDILHLLDELGLIEPDPGC
jgi:PqqD family protein of HPr-rel-A system